MFRIKITKPFQISVIFLILLSTQLIRTVQAEPFIYVTNAIGASVSVIDTQSNTVIKTIPLDGGDPVEGGEPVAVAIHPFEDIAYVNDRHLGVTHVIDTLTHTKIDTIELEYSPDAGVKFHPDGSRAYVTHRIPRSNGFMSIIDTTSHQVLETVEMGRTPSGVALHPDNVAYVCNFISNDIYIVDLDDNSIITVLPSGSEPQGLTISPDYRFVYVSNKGDGTISVIDTAINDIVAVVPVGASPGLIDFSADSSIAYVPLRGESFLALMDTSTHTVVDTIDVVRGGYVWAAILPDGNSIYLTNQNRDNVGIVDLVSQVLTETIPVGEFPIGLAVVAKTELAIEGVSPRSVKRGEASVILTVNGSGFRSGIQASVPRARGVTINAVTFVDESTVLLEVSTEIDANVSPRNLTFTNSNGQEMTKDRAFRVLSL